MTGITQKSLLGHKHAGHIAGMHIMTTQAFTFFEELMVGSTFSGLHQFSVAFAAQLGIIRGNGQKLFLFAAMGPMALKTFAFQYRFMRIGFHELRLGLKVATIADRGCIGLEHAIKIGAMGVMAFAAGAFHKGLVGLEGLLFLRYAVMAFQAYHLLLGGKQLGLRTGMPDMTGQTSFALRNRLVGGRHGRLAVGMTAVAQGVARTHQQGRILGSMGQMTRQALALLERLVLHNSSGHEINGFMTLQTQIAALFQCAKSLFRLGRVMACIAGGFHHRSMDAGLQQFGLQGSVRIMTTGAIGSFHRIVVMGFFKCRLLGRMAGSAQDNALVSQQIGLIRTV